MHVISIVSGGMDSTVLAYHVKDLGNTQTILSFDYGQRHVKELQYAARTARKLGVEHLVVNMRPIGRAVMSASVLTQSTNPVPEGHYADENMKATVVPNRNMIMLSLAVGLAVSRKAGAVATAVHAGDHAIYPDCRPEFIKSFEQTARIANEGFVVPDFEVWAPYVHSSKAAIAAAGDRLKVSFENTWSCYNGSDIHCGRCATCIERREALALADVADPTEYEVDFNTSMRIGKINMSAPTPTS